MDCINSVKKIQGNRPAPRNPAGPCRKGTVRRNPPSCTPHNPCGDVQKIVFNRGTRRADKFRVKAQSVRGFNIQREIGWAIPHPTTGGAFLLHVHGAEGQPWRVRSLRSVRKLLKKFGATFIHVVYMEGGQA